MDPLPSFLDGMLLSCVFDQRGNGTTERSQALPGSETHSLAEAAVLAKASRLDALAFVISVVTSPFLVCTIAAGALAMHLAPSLREGLVWGVLTGLFAGIVPFLLVYFMYATGHVSDLHVAQRERRYLPLSASVLSGGIGLVALWSVDAPLSLSALVVAYILNATVFIVVSFWWKASVHAAAYTGAFTSCALVIGPGWWYGLVGLPLVIWARTRRGRHNLLQGVGGAALAWAITVAAYTTVMFSCSP